MEIILFILLLGVWAVLVMPSVIRSRRENAVTTRSGAQGDTRRATEHREQVLGRRRMALIALGVAVIATLAAAIFTGSWPILAVSLVVDVMLAAYVAILLQIKQHKGSAPPGGHDRSDGGAGARAR